MAALERVHPDAGGEYVRVPNQYGQRAAATQPFDAPVFEATGEFVEPQPRQSRGVLGLGMTPGELSLVLSVGFIAWRYLR